MASEPIVTNMSEEMEIKLLAMHYIHGKATDSVSDFLARYRQAQEEIKAAYDATKTPFNLDPLIH